MGRHGRAYRDAEASPDEAVRLQEALASMTSRRSCEHGHIDVIHVAPAHFDGPACPDCSNAEYADEIQRREPCIICAALAAPPAALDVRAVTETLRFLYHADEPCDAPNKHRHEHIAAGIVGQYPRFAVRLTTPKEPKR